MCVLSELSLVALSTAAVSCPVASRFSKQYLVSTQRSYRFCRELLHSSTVSCYKTVSKTLLLLESLSKELEIMRFDGCHPSEFGNLLNKISFWHVFEWRCYRVSLKSDHFLLFLNTAQQCDFATNHKNTHI